MPAEVSLREGFLPLGLAHKVKLKRAVPKGAQLRWDDVEIDPQDRTVQVRREMERMFAPA